MTEPPETPEPPAPAGPPAPPAAPCGWLSDLPTFYGAPPRVVRLQLEHFVRNAGAE